MVLMDSPSPCQRYAPRPKREKYRMKWNWKKKPLAFSMKRRATLLNMTLKELGFLSTAKQRL